MTLREEAKRKEHENKMVNVKENIEADHKNVTKYDQFKAIELPDYVKQKRFEILMRQQKNRRKRAKEKAMKEYQNQFKPFSFLLREEQKYEILRRSASTSNLLDMGTKSKDFEATPFPSHIFTNFAEEQMKERENYRQVQRKLRQEMMLQKASFPPRMETDLLKKKLKENKVIGLFDDCVSTIFVFISW